MGNGPVRRPPFGSGKSGAPQGANISPAGNEGSPRYRIGPLTAYVDADELRAAFARARAGMALTYAIGPALGKDGATLRLVRGWVSAGAARPVPLVRDESGRGFVYRISKVSPAAPHITAGQAAVGKGAAVANNAAAPSIYAPGSPEGRLLAVIEDLQGAGQRLPPNADLAEMAGLPDGEAARYRLRKLEAAGLVKLDARRGVTLPGKVRT